MTIQENQMNERQITEVSATVDAGLTQEDLDNMGEAERLALVVGAAYGNALADRDDARYQVADLEDRLNQARALLEKAYPILEESSWATDTRLADSIQAYLQDVDSSTTPTQED